MVKTPEALAIANQHHQAGRLQVAEEVYREILADEPNQPDALHLLGLIAHQTGRHALALETIGRAVQLQGNVAFFHNNLGEANRALRRISEAVACYRRALELNPDFAEAHCNLGIALKIQGKLDEAVICWCRAVELNPDYAAAHYNLGNGMRDRGNLDEAIACWRRAVELKPDYVEAHTNLGNAYKNQEKLEEAMASYRRALQLKPDYSLAHNNLGVAFKEQGKPDEAITCYRRAVELKPDYAEAHNNMGVAFKEQGKLEEAIACYRRAVEVKPNYPAAYNNLGSALRDQGKLNEAIACCDRALELKPDYAEAHDNRGISCKEMGNLDEAIACCRRALVLKPNYAEAHGNLGNALREQGKPDEAIASYRRALELKPDYAEVHNNLGVAFKEQGNSTEAIACYCRALKLKSDFAEAYNNLGVAFKEQGKLDEAIAAFRGALELRPNYAEAHSNLLFTLQYHTGVTPAALADAHAEYDRRHAAPLWPSAEPTGRTKVHPTNDRLRLGFVSPDLGRHPVGYFLVRVLENLGPRQYETICYSDRIVKDELTHRLQSAANQWRDVIGTSDEALTEQIRADRIDILFDLAGHTARNRLLVFARKAAPIQVTWAGYVGTTGLKAMDYLLADRYEVPPGAERHYQERVLRMPDGYVCYDPPKYAPPVGPLPALDRGQVTLGCFNNPAKITPQVVEVWAEILRRLPAATFVLKFKGWNDGGIARRVAEMFVAHAIDPGRLEFLGCSPHAELLAEYNRIDLALDSFPYSGGLTTCEALWMGVPVVTCPGETFASRHSLSHLSNVGLTETIARDLDEYVDLAVSLAGDLPRLARLRAGLRQQMAVSPLCDGKRFAASLASMLHDICEQRPGNGNDNVEEVLKNQ